jgi:DNA-binding NarL/FixJ family response regulator
LVVDAGALAGMPGEFFRSVRRTNERAKVIVLDAEATDDHLLELLFLGVTGFVAYDRAPFDLVKAIRTVAGGSPWIPAEVLRQFDQRKELLASGLRRTLLTSKEETVYGLLERGMCNKEIASALSLSVSTVKFHLKNIFAKIGVHDRLRAVGELRRQRSPKPAPLAA